MFRVNPKWAILSILTLGLNGCLKLDPLNYKASVGAPEGTAIEREAWAKEHLGTPYQNVVHWIQNAPVVEENLGEIKQIAPIGTPNYLESFFTDGLFGNFTIEIVGDKQKAVLSVKDSHPCYLKNDGKVYVCFKKGVLSTEYNRIAVNSRGISQLKLQQIQNQEEIVELTKQIESHNEKSISEDFAILEKLLVQRYKLYAENQNYKLAIQDLESVIATMQKGSAPKASYKQLEGVERDNSRRFDYYNYSLAKNYYHAEQFTKAAALFKQSLDTRLVRGLNSTLDSQQIELWIARIRAGQNAIADRELKESLVLAEEKQNQCYSIYAKYLLKQITEEDLLGQASQPVKGYCIHETANQRLALAYFYIGQKEIAEGKTKSGRKNLHKFLSKRGDNPSLDFIGGEYSAAIKELSKVIKLE